MKNVAFLLILLFMSSSLLAQFENINLSKYKLPDIKRRQLDVNFYSKNSTNRQFFTYNNHLDSIETNRKNFMMDFGGSLSVYRNSDKFQSDFSLDFSSDMEFVKGLNSDHNSYKSNDYEFYVVLNHDFKRFFNLKKWFYTIKPKIIVDFEQKNNIASYEETTKDIYNVNLLCIGIGKGRVEQVQDFRHAKLLLDELNKRGVLLKNIQEMDLLEFASMISILKNKRFFDSRIRKESELLELDNYLHESGLINITDMNYFTGLNDIWIYGDLQKRLSGKQFIFTIAPEYIYSKFTFVEADINHKDKDLIYITNLSYNVYDPLSEKIQSNFDINLRNYSSGILFNEKFEKYFNTFVSTNYTLGYFPDTRTYFSISGGIRIGYISQVKIFNQGDYNCSVSLGSQGYYYISERLRLNYKFEYYTNRNFIFDSNNPDSEVNNLIFNIGLNFAIF